MSCDMETHHCRDMEPCLGEAWLHTSHQTPQVSTISALGGCWWGLQIMLSFWNIRNVTPLTAGTIWLSRHYRCYHHHYQLLPLQSEPKEWWFSVLSKKYYYILCQKIFKLFPLQSGRQQQQQRREQQRPRCRSWRGLPPSPSTLGWAGCSRITAPSSSPRKDPNMLAPLCCY